MDALPAYARTPKRWKDVEVILDAGMDVLTTLNIQHLESLSDVIYDITGVTEAETIPDEVVRRAEEIELVDLAEEGISERMVAGKIYEAEQMDAALANYFRPGNLAASSSCLTLIRDRTEQSISARNARSVACS